MSDLVERLQEEGSTGLDLSPGDPLCMEAAVEIKRLRGEELRLLRNLREYSTVIHTLRRAIDDYLESTHEDAVDGLRNVLIETEGK